MSGLDRAMLGSILRASEAISADVASLLRKPHLRCDPRLALARAFCKQAHRELLMAFTEAAPPPAAPPLPRLYKNNSDEPC